MSPLSTFAAKVAEATDGVGKPVAPAAKKHSALVYYMMRCMPYAQHQDIDFMQHGISLFCSPRLFVVTFSLRRMIEPLA